MKANLDEIARTITNEAGKTFDESKAEMVRAIENVEVACGIPMLMKGEIAEDIAPGIDEMMLRQPVGVVRHHLPVQLPRHDSLLVPAVCHRLRQHLHHQALRKSADDHAANLPADRPDWAAAGRDQPGQRAARRSTPSWTIPPSARSLCGLFPVARYIYRRAAEQGKRVQAQGGAKNPVVILPDADMEMTVRIVADSAFGCAGQRCLAVSWAVTVGEARNLLWR
jgi:malonate-semialdehyde dehydrogenase (acetylating) / methylmalonate-semialdehyde dehydrogenase